MYSTLGQCILCSKICPLCFLAFPEFLAYHAHFYASQILIMLTIFADYGEN